ncbi:hypothetical protein [Bacillus sp. JJ722]|uniref:hypothetical protein n=1 Tax=Bacillus sp. JJ722 TaxID=3122973 RepID=UPI0030009A68
MLKFELKKLVLNRFLFPILIIVCALWSFILFHSSESSVQQAFNFWDKLGSLTLGMIILLITTRLFSIDIEEHTEEVFNTTKLGKRTLFVTRIKAVSIFISFQTFLLTIIQFLIPLIFTKVKQPLIVPFDMNLFKYVIMQYVIITGGAVLFAIFAAQICSNFKSHNISILICGLLFGLNYIIRVSMVDVLSFPWLLDKGFFSYLIRGELLEIWVSKNIDIIYLGVWYVFLIFTMYVINKKIQTRRKEA